jgi:hypothetical protein
VFQDRQKSFDGLRIELRQCAAPELCYSFVMCAGFPVDTLVCDGVICIDHRQDAGSQGDLLPTQPIGVSAAVESFVVGAYDGRHTFEFFNVIQELGALPWVLAH